MVEEVFAEIEDGTAVLHWTVRYDGWVNNNMYRGRPWENGAPTTNTLEAAKAAAEAQFDEGLWYWAGNYVVPEAYTWVWQTSTNSYRAGMIRAYNQASFDDLLAGLGLGVTSIGLYLIGTTYDGPSGMTPTFDDQGDGLSEEFELVDEKIGAPFVFEVMRNDVHPAWPTQTPTSDNTGYTRGYITRADCTGISKGFLFKWNFTMP